MKFINKQLNKGMIMNIEQMAADVSKTITDATDKLLSKMAELKKTEDPTPPAGNEKFDEITKSIGDLTSGLSEVKEQINALVEKLSTKSVEEQENKLGEPDDNKSATDEFAKKMGFNPEDVDVHIIEKKKSVIDNNDQKTVIAKSLNDLTPEQAKEALDVWLAQTVNK